MITTPINPRSPDSSDMNNVKVEAAFKSFDYIIDNNVLRTSRRFNEIYHKFYVNDLNPTRFYFLDDINKYNFNYDYQIGSTSNDLDIILQPNGKNIPKYLA